jgi:hypothetical protein
MGPTRKRDLAAAALGTAVAGYLLVVLLYRWFPPITIWTGLSLFAVGVAEAGWGRYVRTKISDGEIGDGPGWLHPLSVARSLVVGKASAWVGAMALGWCSCCPGGHGSGWRAQTPPGRRSRPSARWLW